MGKSQGLKRAKELFLYSDSEPNEVMIGMCHTIALPCAMVTDMQNTSFLFIGIAMSVGLYQLWSALFSGCLDHRLRSVQFACLLSLLTIENLWSMDLLKGSSVGWCIVFIMALWNAVRVTKEKLARNK